MWSGAASPKTKTYTCIRADLLQLAGAGVRKGPKKCS
jgi:hypothetical protein